MLAEFYLYNLFIYEVLITLWNISRKQILIHLYCSKLQTNKLIFYNRGEREKTCDFEKNMAENYF